MKKCNSGIWRYVKYVKMREKVFMKILVSIGHPAHVHLFKNLIWSLEEKGHKVKIVARNKDIAKNLLDLYGFDYTVISTAEKGLFGLGIESVCRTLKFIPLIKNFNPDVMLSMTDPTLGICGRMFNRTFISMTDTENATLQIKSSLPFADAILTPSCFKKELGIKQIRYEGYHELAYLHPSQFTPDVDVLNELGLKENDIFTIMRFVSWDATHDVGHEGLTLTDKVRAVSEIAKYGRVLITSEKELPDELKEYQIKVSPEKIHHLLYYATLLYGESATMASEAAVLGTHSIYCDHAGRGYTDEEEEKYSLVYNFYDEETMGEESLAKALELLENPNLKVEGKMKREKLLTDKIDVTDFLVNFLEKELKLNK